MGPHCDLLLQEVNKWNALCKWISQVRNHSSFSKSKFTGKKWGVSTVVFFGSQWFTFPTHTSPPSAAQTSKICENVCVLFFPWLFPPPFTVLGCQAILVSERNKSFRRGSVGQPLSPTKSSRIRSQRPLSPQPAGLREIYCEERKKVVISWHFHDETWPKHCWLGGL